MISSPNGMSLLDIAEKHLSNNPGKHTMVEVLDTAVAIRGFMDRYPRMTKVILEKGNLSRQLRYWHRKNDGGEPSNR